MAQTKYDTKVIAYQTQLRAQGLYTGAIDGILGPLTLAAIERFQALIGAPQTGQLTATQSRQLQSFGAPHRASEKDAQIAFPHDDTASLIAYYGALDSIEPKLVSIQLAYPLEIVWQPGTYVNHIRVHSRCSYAFKTLFELIADIYTREQIKAYKLDQYGGAYVNRVIRGGSRPSTHAFGCAIDLAPAQNQLAWKNDKALFAKDLYIPFRDAIKQVGLTNLGVAKNYDWMHIQAAWC